MKKGDLVIIKPITQLLKEGWEPIVWGWIKNRTNNKNFAHKEKNYYHGVEEVLGKLRQLTISQTPDKYDQDVHCVETDYGIAKEVIGMVIP